MTVLDLPDGYLIRFHTGEEVFSGLVAFAKQAGITAAWVNALGAMSSAELGYWDAEARQYMRLPVEEEVEVAALVGNIARFDGEPIPHLHATLTRRDFSALGGHLFKGVAGATVEVYVRNYPNVGLTRARDEAVGLNLWSLPREFRPGH
jgi:predicted DNA-binding protein with PD1-like motif